MEAHALIVLGGGPAGYAAALYGARAGIETLVVEKLSAGGQVALTEWVDNYPGFDAGVDGFELGERMRRGAERFGARTRIAEATALARADGEWIVYTSAGELRARAIIAATGARPRALGLENETALRGRGVHNCAACDGMRYQNGTVVVVGGGNSAAADALTLSRISARVVIVHRRGTLRAEKIYLDALARAENVEFCLDSVVEALEGERRLEAVRIRHLPSGGERRLEVDAAFIAIGRDPETALFRGIAELDAAGYIVANEDTRTSAAGLFAAGDVRAKPLRQIVSAVSDGAVAATQAQAYLAEIGS